ncbi:MAG TPA: PIN domain-containing protein [Candidatus Udaeobacter sp.]|nr:PIN domain-containing protein [Candidatus Udaeobacter sp.]
MGLVLDTSALVELERLLPGQASSDLPWEEDLIVPAIVWAEALAGVRLADTPLRAAQRRARLEAVRVHVPIEPFSAEIAEYYADIFAELMHSGQMIPQNDIAVAATARAAGFGVLTGPQDEKHFKRIHGLPVRVLRARAR